MFIFFTIVTYFASRLQTFRGTQSAWAASLKGRGPCGKGVGRQWRGVLSRILNFHDGKGAGRRITDNRQRFRIRFPLIFRRNLAVLHSRDCLFSMQNDSFSPPKRLVSFPKTDRTTVKTSLVCNTKKPCLHYKEALFATRNELLCGEESPRLLQDICKLLKISTLHIITFFLHKPPYFPRKHGQSIFPFKIIEICRSTNACFRTPKSFFPSDAERK